ncbi:ubiquinol oxidase subunit II [Fangia hongkongensis]|uniref:ubiquinol oxidase subunit II n=1 Tax=Fangia hongkongensis TaxID=270495 RepID=UPI00036D2821|nr:ubiquinol oxidase subunit II [Fangia hongkongensis]MBK2123662.1 ubiquinol oxidase subunit II [Fangia hongkongensis]
MNKYLYFFVSKARSLLGLSRSSERHSNSVVTENVNKRKRLNIKSLILAFFLLPATVLLAGCDSGMIDPQGPVASYELKLLIFATVLMLIVVIPVIFLTLWFAWRYRASATDSKYKPEWSHSTKLEIIWWAIPCVIILILAIVTWVTTHKLNPYKPLDSDKKPVEIQVIALDWKWLFIYPEYKIATVNYIEIPTHRPINFKISSAAPMNSFLIPQLGGQIYAMTGMTTQLHLLASNEGKYRGFSANYTGTGFAHMEFYAKATSEEGFNKWVKQVKASQKDLTWNYFWDHLVKRSIDNPVTYYGTVDKNLFQDVVMSYMMPDYKPGMMMHHHMHMSH